MQKEVGDVYRPAHYLSPATPGCLTPVGAAQLWVGTVRGPGADCPGAAHPGAHGARVDCAGPTHRGGGAVTPVRKMTHWCGENACAAGGRRKRAHRSRACGAQTE